VTAEGLRNLHGEDLHNLYSSQNTVRIIRSRGAKIKKPDWIEIKF
jgi:hypothetical protein